MHVCVSAMTYIYIVCLEWTKYRQLQRTEGDSQQEYQHGERGTAS